MGASLPKLIARYVNAETLDPPLLQTRPGQCPLCLHKLPGNASWLTVMPLMDWGVDHCATCKLFWPSFLDGQRTIDV